MKIASSTVAMVSNHLKENKHAVVEEFRVWANPPSRSTGIDTVELSGKTMPLSEEESSTASLDMEEVIQNDPKLFILKELIEALTGRQIKLYKGPETDDSPQNRAMEDLSRMDPPEGANRVGWGVQYEHHETYSEKERTAFAAAGIVKTADGREIPFSVRLNMSREFFQSTDISLRAGDALLDPLVINFNGNAAKLTDQKFAFDLDSDGIDENISFVAAGSGFLVFDRNADRKVNSGSELFGPATGNGFGELSALDETRDGWIDESDRGYARLYSWMKDENGQDALKGLKESGVGAIYLPAAETAFDVKNGNNETEGRIRRTGIYVSEDGRAGTIQQIDLAV
ncbi:MAG: VCBS repeat-containing protein [Deltaproteobacteria bacterium]|nr:VCBS repeat-containing protein [Deltaproteobacteria bacterium]